MKDNWIDKIERKYSKYALHNLSLYMVICFAIGYALAILPSTSGILDYLSLEPSKILKVSALTT